MIASFFVYAQVKDWGGCVVDGVATIKCLDTVFSNLLTFATAFVMVILFAMFIIGSIRYLISAGDPEKVKKARGTFKYALIGLILFIGSYIILNIIQTLFLGGTNTKGPSIFKFAIPDPDGISPNPTPDDGPGSLQYCKKDFPKIQYPYPFNSCDSFCRWHNSSLYSSGYCAPNGGHDPITGCKNGDAQIEPPQAPQCIPNGFCDGTRHQAECCCVN